MDYGLVWVCGVILITIITAWRGIQALPKGFATSSERNLSLAASFDEVCAVIPAVIFENHWKLQEADASKGHFKAKIGVSLHTIGSTFLIDVGKATENTLTVHLFCGTRSSNDPEHNDRMIAKFAAGLEDIFKSHEIVHASD